MKPGSVRWNRENARRARAGLPQLGAGDTAADAPNAPNRPGAPATARRATPRRDNTAALRAVQAQSGPVSSLPNDSAKRAARLAASQDANTVGMLAGGLAQAVSLGFGMLARTRGEHWAITESDAAALGTAWAPVAAYYGGDMDPLTMLWVGAITGTVAVVAPRIVADVEAQRGGRARQVPNVSSPAPHAPAAPPVNVPHVVVDDVPPGMARAPYTGSGAP